MKVYLCGSVVADTILLVEKCLQHAGFTVVKVCSVTTAEYRKGTASRGLGRLWLRFRMYVAQLIRVVWQVTFAPRGSVFIAQTNPFFVPCVVALIGKLRGFRVIHYMSDLFPDAIEVNRPASPMLVGVVGLMTKLSLKYSSAVVFLGEILKLHCEKRWGRPHTTAIIPVGTDETPFERLGLTSHNGRLNCHFGGQLGKMHDIPTLISCVRTLHEGTSLDRSKFWFSFRSSGEHFESLRESFKDLPIEVAGPFLNWQKEITAFQLGLVSISPAAGTVCNPGRTYSMFAAGIAVVAICPAWSDLGKLIVELDLGWVVNNSPFSTFAELEAGNYFERIRAKRDTHEVAKEFCAVISRVIANPDELQRKRENARRVSIANFGVKPLASLWQKVIVPAPQSIC